MNSGNLDTRDADANLSYSIGAHIDSDVDITTQNERQTHYFTITFRDEHGRDHRLEITLIFIAN